MPGPFSVAEGLRLNPIMEMKKLGSLPPPKLTDITSSASTVNYAVRVCVLAPVLMGPPPFKKKREPEVNVRGGVSTKAVDVTSGSRSCSAESAGFCCRFYPRLPFRCHERANSLQLTVGPCVGGRGSRGGTRHRRSS